VLFVDFCLFKDENNSAFFSGAISFPAISRRMAGDFLDQKVNLKKMFKEKKVNFLSFLFAQTYFW